MNDAIAQDSFESLGFLPEASTEASSATGVSADGSVAVGSSVNADGNNEAFRWEGGTMTGLGFLPGAASEQSLAFAISPDASVIVGFATNADGNNEAFRWEGGTMVGLGFLPGATPEFSIAFDVSADGDVVVGYSSNVTGITEAFRWEGGTMTGLGFLPGATVLFSLARGVSADGSVVVGDSGNANGGTEAYRWEGGTMTGLGHLPGATSEFSLALGVNADGSVVVGSSTNSDGNVEAFRWEGGTMIGLGFIPGAFIEGSEAHAVSADGGIVVGLSYDATNQKAFRWTQANGMESIQALLETAGVDLTDWQLYDASDISDSGNTVVGTGLNPNGQTEAWIARFGPESGLITPSEAARSLSGLTVLSEGIASWLDSGLATQSEIARHHRCVRRGGPTTPFCAFAYLEGGTFLDDNGETGSATLGLKTDVANGWVLGASARGGLSDTPLHENGSGDFDLISGNIFLATVPDTGFQFVLAGTVASFNGDIHRGYMNGAGTSVSNGDTDGTGYAGSVRVGWAFMPSTGNVYVTPFADYSIARVEIDSWTETTGPFPAAINDINDMANKLRLGAEGRINIGPESWMWGSLAWGHRFESNSAAFTGDLIDLFEVAAPGTPLEQDWLEATAGVRLPVTAGSAMTASVTTQAFSDDVPLVQGRLGFSSQF